MNIFKKKFVFIYGGELSGKTTLLGKIALDRLNQGKDVVFLTIDLPMMHQTIKQLSHLPKEIFTTYQTIKLRDYETLIVDDLRLFNDSQFIPKFVDLISLGDDPKMVMASVPTSSEHWMYDYFSPNKRKKSIISDDLMVIKI